MVMSRDRLYLLPDKTAVSGSRRRLSFNRFIMLENNASMFVCKMSKARDRPVLS